MESANASKKWSARHYLFFGLLAVIGLLVVAVAIQNPPSLTDDKTDDPSSLHAKILTGVGGISIENNEAVDWQDCMFGLNGPTGWGMENPPYKTHSPLTIPAGQTVILNFRDITAEDGTRFDYSTHAIHSVALICNIHDLTNWRIWTGTVK